MGQSPGHTWNETPTGDIARPFVDIAGVRENFLRAGTKAQPMINSVALQRTERDNAQWENVMRQYEEALRAREPKKILAVEPAS